MVKAVPFEEKYFLGVCKTMLACGSDLKKKVFHRHFLENPRHGRAGDCSAIQGLVLIDGEKVVGFLGLVARELYLGQQSRLTYEMGVLGIEKEYRLYAPLLTNMLQKQEGALAFYGNTVNFQASRMWKALRFKEAIQSCSFIRYRVVCWRAFLLNVRSRYKYTRRIPLWIIKFVGHLFNVVLRIAMPLPTVRSHTRCRIMTLIDDHLFSVFWGHYIEINAGLVSSREPVVLHWLFGQELKCGNDHLIGRFEHESLVGYIVLRKNTLPDGISVRFFVADWIALGNDINVLGDLLRDACSHVRSQGGAVLEIIGYPEAVQVMISRYLPLRRVTASNTFVYKTADPSLVDSFYQHANAGWFWGAFDADRCVMG